MAGGGRLEVCGWRFGRLWRIVGVYIRSDTSLTEVGVAAVEGKLEMSIGAKMVKMVGVMYLRGGVKPLKTWWGRRYAVSATATLLTDNVNYLT